MAQIINSQEFGKDLITLVMRSFFYIRYLDIMERKKEDEWKKYVGFSVAAKMIIRYNIIIYR